jgi:hypothetical protein
MMTERAKDAGESERRTVMARIGTTRVERGRDPFRKEADFQQVFSGDELELERNNHSGVNR